MKTSFIYTHQKIGNLEVIIEHEQVVEVLFTKKDIKKGVTLDSFQKEIKKALDQYFAMGPENFVIPLRVSGTPFQMAVWEQIAKIPYGKTKTYSNIAKAIKKPKAVRAIGTACGANPVPIFIPCHRVLPMSGGLGNYAGGKDKKKFLLELERTVLCNQKK